MCHNTMNAKRHLCKSGNHLQNVVMIVTAGVCGLVCAVICMLNSYYLIFVYISYTLFLYGTANFYLNTLLFCQFQCQ